MPLLIACCAVLVAATAASTPRIAHRLAVDGGCPPRSSCVHCGDPFPRGLPGWVRVGSACPRRCSRPSGAGWPALLGAVLGGGLAAVLGPSPELLAYLAAAVLGVLLAAVDVACLRLPDVLVAALFAAIVGPLTAVALGTGDPWRLGRAAVAGLLCGAVYLAVALLPGGPLGFGDVKLGAVLGILLGWVGWPAVAAGLLLPHLLNGPVVLGLLLTRRITRRTALPFGPALLSGAFLAVLLT